MWIQADPDPEKDQGNLRGSRRIRKNIKGIYVIQADLDTEKDQGNL